MAIELIRLAGSLERLSVVDKESMLEIMVGAVLKKKLEPLYPALLWAIGRMGSRIPLYAGYDHSVRPERIEANLRRILESPTLQGEGHRNHVALCLVQCARLTGDRRRDLSQGFRRKAVELLDRWEVSSKFIRPIEERETNVEDLDSIVGDALPLGFSLKG